MKNEGELGRVGSGRAVSGRVGSGLVGLGRVGSGQSIFPSSAIQTLVSLFTNK